MKRYSTIIVVLANKMDETFQEIQAIQSALYFLCLINADASVVHQFLLSYPEALLFEGINTTFDNRNDYSTGLEDLISAQMDRCRCFSTTCNENRLKVLELIRKGFKYFRSKRNSSNPSLDDGNPLDRHPFSVGCGDWQKYSRQLQSLEKDLQEIGGLRRMLPSRNGSGRRRC